MAFIVINKTVVSLVSSAFGQVIPKVVSYYKYKFGGQKWGSCNDAAMPWARGPPIYLFTLGISGFRFALPSVSVTSNVHLFGMEKWNPMADSHPHPAPSLVKADREYGRRRKNTVKCRHCNTELKQGSLVRHLRAKHPDKRFTRQAICWSGMMYLSFVIWGQRY